jgi:phosphoribosylanthranilate isomerase
MIIQIYAFTEIEQAQQAARMGVDQIGFVAGDYGVVPGELSFKDARELVISLPSNTHSVALTMATDINEILRMVRSVQPDIVHISTDVFDVDAEAMKKLRNRLSPSVQLMKAIPVQNESSVAIAEEFATLCDYLLLDSKTAGMPGVGATGETHDWRLSKRIVDSVDIPVILAGGLNPDNIVDAIREVGPEGVDSNTGTNIPGSNVKKDMQRIEQFVNSVRYFINNMDNSDG